MAHRFIQRPESHVDVVHGEKEWGDKFQAAPVGWIVAQHRLRRPKGVADFVLIHQAFGFRKPGIGRRFALTA